MACEDVSLHGVVFITYNVESSPKKRNKFGIMPKRSRYKVASSTLFSPSGSLHAIVGLDSVLASTKMVICLRLGIFKGLQRSLSDIEAFVSVAHG